ncbi:MAG: lactoylglutathione lyase [Alphaproteobacteria bacterium]|nr:lactoylglutathione lyase [Alphaproteobacteria bacterium]
MAQPLFPVEGIPCAGIVVRDYRSSIEQFARFFGIAEWRVRRFDGNDLIDSHVHGDIMHASWISARGSNGRVAFELIQPTGGQSLFERHMHQRGEGMFGVQTASLSQHRIDDIAARAVEAGIHVLQECRLGGERFVWLDTRQELGVVTMLQGGGDAGPDGERVDMSAVAAKGPPLPVQKHYHFGIVCRDRNATKAAYERLYAMDKWIEFMIETDVTLTDTFYYGKPVKHAYDNWVGRRDGFAVELIEMRYGDAVYQEMLDTIGDGAHHVFPTICSPEEFAAAQDFFAANDMPIIQSGRIGGLIDYFYVDVRRKLAGLTLEVVTPLAENWLETMLPGEAGYVLMGPDVK